MQETQEMQVRLLGQEDLGRKWQPIQYSCLENSVDRGAWRATVHGIAKELYTLNSVTKQQQQ